jgi:BON domain
MIKRFIATGVTLFWLFAAVSRSVQAAQPQQDKPTLEKNSLTDADRNQRLQNMLAAAVRHELVTLPYYDVFDWLQAELLPDGTVILEGEVVRPATSDDAERRIHKIESVTRAALKGAVASQLESQLAFNAAHQIPGIFEVTNELRIDNGL